MRIWLGTVALLAGLVAAASVSSQANTACAGYSVTAPVVGTHSDSRCAPVQEPPIFSHPFGGGACPSVPPAGVAACASVGMYLP
jgi:hypothetical protein